MSDSFGERGAASNRRYVKRLPQIQSIEQRRARRVLPGSARACGTLALMLCALLPRAAASQPRSVSFTREVARPAEADAVPALASPFLRDDRYHYVAGARLSAGAGGFDTELGTISEVYVRYQWRHGLGVSASYFHLSVGNNESYERFGAHAITLGPAWHPLKDFWFDPFIEGHLVGLLSIAGGGPFGYADPSGMFHQEELSRVGIEGITGLQLASRYVAGGPHMRMGTTDRQWWMFGLHLELRF